SRANTATATGTDPNGQTVSDDDTATVPLAKAPALSPTKGGTLDKTVVAPNDRADVGDKINYTLKAKNTGNVTLTGVTISDPKLRTLTFTQTQPTTLAPGPQLVCTGSYTLTQDDINSGKVDNTATVNGTD